VNIAVSGELVEPRLSALAALRQAQDERIAASEHGFDRLRSQ